MDDEDRHQRCILCDSDPPAASEISEVSVERKMLSVYVPPIWTGVCPKGFHKALDASSGVPEEQRYALCCLHRRPSFDAPGQGKAERIRSNSLSSAQITGIFDKLSQVSARTNSNSDIPGIYNQFCGKGTESSCREVREDCSGSQDNDEGPYSLSPITCPADREDDSGYPGSPPSSFALLRSAAPQASGLEERKKGYDGQVTLSLGARKDVHWWVKNLATWNERVVREMSTNVVIETDASKTGWGAFCQGILTGGCWNAQEVELHINSLQMLAAFYAINAFVKNCQGILVLLRTDMSEVTYVNRMGGTKSPLLTAQAIDLWSWCLQRKITVAAQYIPGPENVTADYLSRHLRDRTDWVLEPTIFNCVNSQWGPLHLFATRFSKQLPHFLQLATGPQSRGYRCVCTELDQYPRLCTPSLVSNFTSPSESSGRPSNSGADHPIMAHTAMVPGFNGSAGGLSTPPAQDGRGNKAISELRLPSTGVTSSTGHLEGLRQRFRAEKISDQAIDLILSSWRDKTNSNYNSVWKAWESWCAARGVHPFLSTISDVLDFLAEKYAAGLKYCSLNCSTLFSTVAS